MEDLSIKEVISITEGVAVNYNDNIVFTGVSTDSRNIKKGDLFIALLGSNFDGNEFVNAAYEKGAAAALVSRKVEGNCPQIVVKDTMVAMQEIAKFYRQKFDIPVIGVTGSTGKTSTKEMIYSVLSQRYRVHKTEKNYNNEIGLPRTMFGLKREHEICVVELGMNRFKEIERLAYIASPNIGVITNIGTAHIENLGSRENILKAKMEIATFFTDKNTLIVNGDDDLLSGISGTTYRLIKFSTKRNGDYNAFDIKDMGEKGIEFSCKYRGEVHIFKTSVPGIHNVYNALAAIAVADMYGLDVQEVKNGILNFSPGKLRMEIIDAGDIKIINDCYNANLDSMKAAIDVLASYKDNRRVAILGDMFELGDFSEEAHRSVGKYLRERCSFFVAIGKDARYIYDEAINEVEGIYFKTKEEALQELNKVIKKDDVILIKASRGMKMEDITEFLTAQRKRGI